MPNGAEEKPLTENIAGIEAEGNTEAIVPNGAEEKPLSENIAGIEAEENTEAIVPEGAEEKPLSENIANIEAEEDTEDEELEENRPAIENCEWPSYIFGIGFAVMGLSKVTVAATLVAVVLTIIGFLAVKRRWGLILKCAMYFFLGVGTVLLPVFAYFAMNGALQDFIFCTFLFAFKRSTDYYEAFSFNWERQLLICYISFFVGVCYRRDRREDGALQALLIVTSLVVYGLLHLGTPYPYYFIGLMPLFCLLTVLFLDYLNKEFMDAKISWIGDPESPAVVLPKLSLRLAVFFLLYLGIIIFYYGDTSNKVNENIYIFCDEVGKTQVEDCKEINELIPPWDRDEVYNLESGMIYYEVNQLLPANKYPVNLPYFLHLHPPIKEEVLNYLHNVRPRWIISENMDGFDDEDVKAYVFSNYEIVASNSGEELYRIKD